MNLLLDGRDDLPSDYKKLLWHANEVGGIGRPSSSRKNMVWSMAERL